MKVPILDLEAQYAGLKAEIDAALQGVCRTGRFALGPEVEAFEVAWAEYCEAEHCVALNSGTSALHVALLALGVGEGDEVITTPLSFFATAEAILYTGARPAFADVDPVTACLDPAAIEGLISERTRAILPVHLYGHPAEMDAILRVGRARGLAVVEDACQAHGALYGDRKVGAIGDAGAFSFYPTKNLGAYGEGGALVTNDSALAERARLLRNHGQQGRYRHAMVGFNYRMDGFQGAVLNVKLKRLDEWAARRRRIVARYGAGLAGTALVLPSEADGVRSSWHLYVVQCEERDALAEHLAQAGVATGVHYPVPLPRLEALAGLGLRGASWPHAERLSSRVLSLPLYPEMSDEQADYVVESIRRFFRSG
jgi:dTDP-4-amino-4,6-dideoxygalactose transaminase